MLNPLRDFVAFDLETTGLERDTDEIIEIGAVRVRGGVIEDRMSCLLKAEKALTPLVESLTGISKEMLEAARDPKECIEEFLRFAGGLPLVAHNSDFDSAFLEHALSKVAMPPLANPVFDSLLLARVAWPAMGSHRLENLVEKLGIPPQKAHRALPDAEQSALLWLKAEEKLAGYSPATLAALGRVLAAGPSQWRDLLGGGQPAFGDAPDMIGANQGGQARESGTTAPGIPAAVPAKPVNASAESLFASGKVADTFAALGRPYQARARQTRMASLVERALKESRFLVAESEPGTGRMLACLVPALIQARARRRPVFVSVAGRGRQERIVTSELPLLENLLGGEVRVEPLKAPSNYVSPRKLAGILAHPETRLSREERLAILPLLTWLEGTRDGDIAGNMGFNHERNKLLWSKLASDSYASEPGSHAHAARERAARAHLVLITHDLFLDDLALDFALLPTYELIVFDEAHRLPEMGQARLGRDVSFFRLKHILQMIAQSKQDASGLLAELERTEGGSPVVETAAPADSRASAAPEETAANADAPEHEGEPAPETGVPESAIPAREPKTDLERLRLKVFEPERQLQKFFNKIAKHAAKRRKDGENRIRYADKLVVEFNAGPEAVIASLVEVEELLARLAPAREDLSQGLRKTADLLRAFRSDLEHLAHPSGTGEVFWIEDFPNPHRALIRSAPLEIGTLLAEKLYPQMDAVVFASSAVALGDEFKFFCRQIGLETAFPDRLKTALVRAGGAPVKASEAPGKAGGAPGKEGRERDERPDPIFLAKFSPVLSNNGALQTMGQILIRGLTRFPVPSFALFTHIGMLKQARGLLQEGLSKAGRMVLAQHVDGSRDNLLHLFRHRPDACLLGTESFVEALGEGDMFPEIVIVTKLPFPVPTEPLIAPHLERLQEAGQNPLYDYLLPCSILRLKQELNRLPRRPGRKLAIWIMDPRLATEKYARFYQRSLGRDAIVCDNEGDLLARTAALLRPELPAEGGSEAALAEAGVAGETSPAHEETRSGQEPGVFLF
ncbi:MAG: polymerase epsilon subunit [Fibrobacteres bacterium]|nr:polymerase epsilon subunit [Fibrobacterota bacterium]